MKLWLAVIGAVFGCALLYAANPEDLKLETVREAYGKLPPPAKRIFVDFERWTPDAALQTAAGKSIRTRVLLDAEAILDIEPCQRIKEGKRLLGVSRQILVRINTLAMAWKLNGEEKYARRAIAEMMAASRFTDWNPFHFLDVGEMAVGLAVGAACFDPVMTPEERKTVADALWEKCLKMSIPGNPDAEKMAPDVKPDLWWLKSRNNWAPVCQAGVIAAALIAGDRDPDLASQMIQRAVKLLPMSMRDCYSPNGAYPEGPDYWTYGTEFTCLVLAMLEHAFGTDFGLSEIPGWSATGDFMAAMAAPTGRSYNFSDGRPWMNAGMAWFYLDAKYPGSMPLTRDFLKKLDGNCKKPAARDRVRSDRLLPLALLWLKPQGDLPERPLWYYSGAGSRMPLAVFRSAWTRNAMYLAIKGGAGRGVPHAHMDGGSFILEADGYRWVVDLGMETYLPLEQRGFSLWTSVQSSDRWKVFRLNSDSHSIIRVDGEPQLVDGWGKITSVVTEQGKPMSATLDLSDLTRNIGSHIRTAEMGKKSISIRDELTGVKPGAKVRFQFCTYAKPEISGNTVILRAKKNFMKVVAAPGILWETAPASRWMQEWDSDNETACMVWFEVTAPADGKVSLQVDYIPGSAAGI